jgi:3-dehydroquinate dehydratase-2
MKILVINGPNINMLGVREPDIYGKNSFSDLLSLLRKIAEDENITVDQFQSNHEGALVDAIQGALGTYDGIVINPGAYTHTSIALLDAVKSVMLPTVEVHISDINSREEFRRHSFVSLVAVKTIAGLGFEGYKVAIEYLKDYLK